MSGCPYWSDGEHLFAVKRGPIGPALPHPRGRQRKPIRVKACACGYEVTRVAIKIGSATGTAGTGKP